MAPIRYAGLLRLNCRAVVPQNQARGLSTLTAHSWSYPPSVSDVAKDEVTRLASSPRRPLTLTDLLK